MQKCTKSSYPSVKRGDTVRNKLTGNVYLVSETRKGGKDLLVNVETGEGLSDHLHLFRGDNPNQWEKVDCCYEVV